MSPRTIVITGASDGIGAAAARKLSTRGERLLLVGRRREKLDAVAHSLGAEPFVADFEKLSDVRALADQIRERTDRIDVLANNAGGVFAERVVTQDGNERTMQVNHYAGFLLTNLLLDALLAGDGTVVNTSSMAGPGLGRIDLADLDATRRYRAMKVYGDSKLANILFTVGLHARYADRGLKAVAFHPGVISSNFGRETGGALVKLFYKSPIARLMTSPDSGADNLVWAIDGTPGVTWQSGEFYIPGRERPARLVRQQKDAELTEAFWAESARRTGLTE